MAKEKLKPVLTSFSPDGEFLALLSPDGTVKIWNTSNGGQLAEWKHPDTDAINYSCMACSYVGKMHKKGRATFLLALGTHDGDVLAIDVFSGDTKWKSDQSNLGGVAGLAFADKGRVLYVVRTNGMISKVSSESGDLILDREASKKPISSVAFSSDASFLSVTGGRTGVLSLENGDSLVKFPNDLGSVQHITVSNNAKGVVTSGFGEKDLQVWRCDLGSRSVCKGPVLSMRHPPFKIKCDNINEKKGEGLVVLAISQYGVAYIWNLKTISQDEVNPTKITVKGSRTETDQKSEITKKSHKSIFAAKLNSLADDGQFTALIAYGLIESPQFRVVNFGDSGKSIVVTATDDMETMQENGALAVKDLNYTQSEATVATGTNRKTKKRAASDMDLSTTGNMVDTDHGEAMVGVLVEDDVNEPTMGEKLASLNLLDNDKTKTQENKESSPQAKPPSADSVNILLKQALRADDRALLLDCLYNRDEKVVMNSIAQLNPSDVLKLLHSLVSIIQSRGAILVCVLPWLRSLLLQHASGIVSHESSLIALNSIYQLIDSRVSSFQQALQLSSCIDINYSGVIDGESEEYESVTPVIYEDKDDSDEEESEDAMETDQDTEEEEDKSGEDFHGYNDFDGSDGMSE